MHEDGTPTEPVVMDAERLERIAGIDNALIEINQQTAPGSVVFCGGSREMLRLEPSGKFFVDGVLAPSSTAEGAEGIYQAFVAWMRATGQLR